VTTPNLNNEVFVEYIMSGVNIKVKIQHKKVNCSLKNFP